MAIQKSIKLNIGIEIQGAYFRIDTVSGYKNSLDISVNTYVSRDAFLNGASLIEQRNYNFKPSVTIGSENFIKQGYEYLKSLPEFENALNVPSDGSPD